MACAPGPPPRRATRARWILQRRSSRRAPTWLRPRPALCRAASSRSAPCRLAAARPPAPPPPRPAPVSHLPRIRAPLKRTRWSQATSRQERARARARARACSWWCVQRWGWRSCIKRWRPSASRSPSSSRCSFPLQPAVVGEARGLRPAGWRARRRRHGACPAAHTCCLRAHGIARWQACCTRQQRHTCAAGKAAGWQCG